MPNLQQKIFHRFYYWRCNLRQIEIEELFPFEPNLILNLHNWHRDLRAGGFLDTATLAFLVRAIRPSICFEIGTGNGRSASIMAANTSDQTTIHTLAPDYPDNPVIGSYFRNELEAKKVEGFECLSEHEKVDLYFEKIQ